MFEKVLLKTTKNYKMKSTKLNLKLLGIDFMLQNDGTNRTPIILFLTLKNYFKASSFFLSSQSAHFPSQAFFKDILWLFFRKQNRQVERCPVQGVGGGGGGGVGYPPRSSIEGMAA